MNLTQSFRGKKNNSRWYRFIISPHFQVIVRPQVASEEEEEEEEEKPKKKKKKVTKKKKKGGKPEPTPAEVLTKTLAQALRLINEQKVGTSKQ